MALTREAILSKQDRGSEVVHIPEWGGDVIVRSISSSEREDLENLMVNQDGSAKPTEHFRELLVAMTLVDEDGNRLFQPEDTPTLAEKDALAILRVFKVAQRLSGLTPEALEEQVGFFDGTRSSPSDGDSPEISE